MSYFILLVVKYPAMIPPEHCRRAILRTSTQILLGLRLSLTHIFLTLRLKKVEYYKSETGISYIIIPPWKREVQMIN